MKTNKFLLSFTLLLAASFLFFTPNATAQSAAKMIGYQAIIRQADGQPLAKKAVTVTITLNKATADGEVLYTEKHENVETSPSGLLSLEIGSKDATTFSAIDWSTADAWLNVRVKNNEVDITTSQKLQAVPYAYYAENVAGLNEKADKADMETKLAEKANVSDLAAKADNEEMKTKLAEKANKSEVDPKLQEIAELKAQLAQAAAQINAIKEIPAVQTGIVQQREALIAQFNAKNAKVTTKYVTDELDAKYCQSLEGVITGGWVLDPTFEKGPTEGSYTGEMKLEIQKNGDDLIMNMTQNAMGLNELALYVVVWNTLGYNTMDYYGYQMTLEKWNLYTEPKDYTLKELCDVIDWHKTAEKIGEMNVMLKNIKVLPPDENNISKLEYFGEIIDVYGETLTPAIPFEFEYSPFTELKRIYDDATDPNHDDIVPIAKKQNGHLTWSNGSPWPNRYFAKSGYSALGDDEEDNYHPELVPDDQKMDNISKFVGQINWATKEITFRFPIEIDQHSTWIYIDVTITPGE